MHIAGGVDGMLLPFMSLFLQQAVVSAMHFTLEINVKLYAQL